MSIETRALAGDLSLAVMRLSRHLRGRRADAQVSLTQLSALATLGREGPMAPGALAGLEKVRPPSMTRSVALLSELGLVERSSHPTDRRQIIVTLSEAGEALLADEIHAREVWMNEQLSGLNADELVMLRGAVGIINAMVSASE
ncbi:MarR family winged helix-turn-helix transcriptional regulator [Rhodococcus qingshengii]|uniref:MarR family winged helix-turn-helix transcriptional regulator n=1 Tax=Rhodococcus qingshengii TaxID=334542 RepID=UPI0036DA0B2C